jgi:hypothetical protein
MALPTHHQCCGAKITGASRQWNFFLEVRTSGPPLQAPLKIDLQVIPSGANWTYRAKIFNVPRPQLLVASIKREKDFR